MSDIKSSQEYRSKYTEHSSNRLLMLKSQQIHRTLTSHLSRAYRTVFNIFSNNKKYPIHSEIIMSTLATGSSISSIFPFRTVITAKKKKKNRVLWWETAIQEKKITERIQIYEITTIGYKRNKRYKKDTIRKSIGFNNFFCHISHMGALDL